MDQIIIHILMAVIGMMLFAAGITDIRKKQISRSAIGALFTACTAAAVMQVDIGLLDALGGLAVGACAAGLSIASREQIGKGDGAVIAAIGVALGARRCLMAVSAALMLMCIAAVAVLILRKGDRRTRLPFIPAIFAGYAVCVWV